MTKQTELAIGLIGLTVGGAGLLGLILTGAHTSYPLLIGPLLAVGCGMSFTAAAATTAAFWLGAAIAAITVSGRSTPTTRSSAVPQAMLPRCDAVVLDHPVLAIGQTSAAIGCCAVRPPGSSTHMRRWPTRTTDCVGKATEEKTCLNSDVS